MTETNLWMRWTTTKVAVYPQVCFMSMPKVWAGFTARPPPPTGSEGGGFTMYHS